MSIILRNATRMLLEEKKLRLQRKQKDPLSFIPPKTRRNSKEKLKHIYVMTIPKLNRFVKSNDTAIFFKILFMNRRKSLGFPHWRRCVRGYAIRDRIEVLE